jgi:hypothetical protein
MSKSERASPGGSIAWYDTCTVRSVFVYVPVFSPQMAAGSTTSAYSAVSVRYASCTITMRSRFCRIVRTRAQSGSETTGFVAEIQSSLIEPCSQYRKICIACVGCDQCGMRSGSTFHIAASRSMWSGLAQLKKVGNSPSAPVSRVFCDVG